MGQHGFERLWQEAPTVAPFFEWATTQGPEVHVRVLVSVMLICGVLEGQSVIEPVEGMPVLDYWAALAAVEDLREMARAAGFVEAVPFFDETRRHLRMQLDEALRWILVLALARGF